MGARQTAAWLPSRMGCHCQLQLRQLHVYCPGGRRRPFSTLDYTRKRARGRSKLESHPVGSGLMVATSVVSSWLHPAKAVLDYQSALCFRHAPVRRHLSRSTGRGLRSICGVPREPSACLSVRRLFVHRALHEQITPERYPEVAGSLPLCPPATTEGQQRSQ